MDTRIKPLFENVRRVIVGKDGVIKLALTALLADGHLLIEDAPGLGKTMLARAIAQSLAARFQRIQFTADLLPSDVTGVSVYVPNRQEFEFFPGPIFSQVLLGDEINRTSPRTQSCLLESMEERQVSVDGRTHLLGRPFFVLATQNPIELEGTYPLPEAQLDRFLMRIRLGYPAPAEEARILELHIDGSPIAKLSPVLACDELVSLQDETKQVTVSREIRSYIVALAGGTRTRRGVRLGVSPRGTVALMRASQAHAFLHGFPFVTPDSVKAVAPFVFAHRLLMHPHHRHGDVVGEDLVADLLREVAVPTVPEPERAPESS